MHLCFNLRHLRSQQQFDTSSSIVVHYVLKMLQMQDSIPKFKKPLLWRPHPIVIRPKASP